MQVDFEALEKIPKEYLEWRFAFPTMGMYYVPGNLLPAPSKGMLFHMAASGFFDRVEILHNHTSLLYWGRSEMQAFVTAHNFKGIEAIERELVGKKRA